MASIKHLPVKDFEADFCSHPAELVREGYIDSRYTTQDLRNAIPAHCFKPSNFWSFWYLIRDLVVAGTLVYTAYNFIPLIGSRSARAFAWAAYGYVQGQQMTGIWVIGHECGHGAFSTNNYLNNAVGWLTHSSLMTPYFSWQSTHRRHHIYANNLAKDHNYVPPQMDEYASLMGVDIEHLRELAEDSPLYTFTRILVQQIFGFPWYLLANITATKGSLANKNPPSKYPMGNSHFLPSSALFRPEEYWLVLASDIGIGLTLFTLWYASTKIVGLGTIILLYVIPYMWVNHWIIAITYLHHTHPNIPKYEPEAWTFLKGATATIDRDLGFGGKHLMHNIAEFHVIHHLFPRIPQYYAEEATNAIMPLLGDSYHADKRRSFWGCIWESFTQCQYVVPSDPTAKPENRAMYYKGGPSPPIEISMGRAGLKID